METYKARRQFRLLLKNTFLTGIAGSFFFLFTTCVEKETPVPEPEEKMEKVTIYFESSGSATPASYALDTEKENEIHSIDVLVFYTENGEERYAYRVMVDPATIEEVDINRRKFTVKLSDDGKAYNYAILANVTDEVSAYFPNSDSRVGMEKEELFKNLVSVQAELWNTDASSSGYRPIPMYGESGVKLISQLKNSTVSVVRTMARVDIISSVPPMLFNLSEVYVYNRNTRGRIAGDQHLLNKSKMIYTAPSLPDNLGMVHPRGNYGNANNGYQLGPSDRELRRTIYLYEADMPSSGIILDAICLVVGGNYRGSSDLQYYRIDFVDSPSEVDAENQGNPNWWEAGPPTSDTGGGGAVGTTNPFQPIIRNHHYEIHITGVATSGQPTKDIASNTLTSTILYDYISWNNLDNEVKIGSTTYKLSVDKTSVTAPGTVNVTVSGTSNWDVIKTSEYDWFNVSVSGNTLSVSLSPSVPNEHLIGYFKIRLKNSSDQVILQKIIRVEKK